MRRGTWEIWGTSWRTARQCHTYTAKATKAKKTTLTRMFPPQCKRQELHVCNSDMLGRGGGGDGGHVAQSERYQQHHRERSRHPRRHGRSRQGEQSQK